MLNEKLLEILSHDVDSVVAIVTKGVDGPHLVNTWNSYIDLIDGNKLLIPAYGFVKTEKNLSADNKVKLSIANREVAGYRGPGTGVIIEGSGEVLKTGKDFNLIKEKFDWARAVLVVSVESAKQTL